MWLRSLDIGKRASLAFALLAAIMLGLGAFSLSQMNRMDDASDEIRDNWLPSLIAHRTSPTASAAYAPSRYARSC